MQNIKECLKYQLVNNIQVIMIDRNKKKQTKEADRQIKTGKRKNCEINYWVRLEKHSD